MILILVVVFIHEYGHYYFAKRYGVGVTDFSIGFGKEIFGWNDKHGTRWKICAIPLGGYVKFFGDRNVYSQSDKQEILEAIDLSDRFDKIMNFIQAELDVMQVEKKIRGRVKNQMEKTQKEYYLNEQMKAIQKELDDDNEGVDDIAEIEEKISKF